MNRHGSTGEGASNQPEECHMDNYTYQELIDSGMAWLMEGNVGRQCWEAIQRGDAVLPPEPTRDYWGTRIPSRDEVVPGTVGSVEYAQRMQEES
jgi:hypothetical protein